MSGSFKLDKFLIQVFIQYQNGGDVVASVAVIWCWPDSDELFVEHFFVALHNKLMGTTYERYIIGVVETLNDVATKQVTGSSGT